MLNLCSCSCAAGASGCIIPVSLLYMAMQLVVSLGFIYLCPDTAICHWIYLFCALIVLAIAYILFLRKYYWMHEAYLRELSARQAQEPEK